MLFGRLVAFFLGTAFALCAQVEFVRGEGQVEIRLDGREFSTFYFGSKAPKPFLHPLRAADGATVTRGFPMERVPGESRDHAHHRGVWFAHGDVNGYDFWANEFGGDLMHLITDPPTPRYCGVAYVMTRNPAAFSEWAFGITIRSCLSGSTMAHELGHNMGCKHDRANSSGASLYPYAFGYR